MSTIAALNKAVVTSVIPLTFNCRGAKNFQITIAPPSSGISTGILLSFARRINGMTGGFEIEEAHSFELLTINDEEIDAIQYRVSAGSVVLTIIAGT